MTLILNVCFSTQRLCVPTSIPLALKKAGGQEIGRSRGGLSTKLHVTVDALGNPLRVILSAGQLSDIDYAAQLIEHLPNPEDATKRIVRKRTVLKHQIPPQPSFVVLRPFRDIDPRIRAAQYSA